MTTTQQAAASIEPHVTELQAKVLATISGFMPQGLTDEGIQLATGMNPSTERPRRIELERAGLIKDSGLTRATTSGRQAKVWVIA